MSFSDERAAIESRFATAWADETPVKYSASDTFQPPTGASWVALHIKPGEAKPGSSNGPRLHLHPGLIIVQIFVPEEQGSAAALTLADAVAAIFRCADFTAGSGPIGCESPYLVPVGPRDGLYQVNVNCRYLRQFFE